MLFGRRVRGERIAEGTPTLAGVVRGITYHPARLIAQWNYKSAVVSALIRSIIFFTANLPAGRSAAWAAFTTEIVLRLATSGFYGGLTQALGRIEPAWQAMLSAMLLLPLVSHSLELTVHLVRGTPALWTSIGASAAFTVVSTAFNVFAMRRGALVTGPGSAPLHADLRRMPALVAAFVGAPLALLWRAAARATRPLTAER